MQSVRTIDKDQFSDRIFFSITPHRWGNRAKVTDPEAHREYLRLVALPKGAKDTAQTENGNGAKKVAAMVRTSSTKPLIESKQLDAINDALTDLKDRLVGRIRGIANPSFLARGIYCIRKDLVSTVEKMITDTETRLNADLKPAFVDDFPTAVDRARTLPPNEGGLGPIFDPKDYPTATEAAAKFWLEWSYLQLGVAEDLPPELRAKKLEEFQRKLTDAAEEITLALRESFQDLITHATEKLTVEPGAKSKVFRDTLIGNIDDFINSFASRNMGDQALAELVEKARKIIRPNGEVIDPDRLRKYANVRDAMQTQFAEIKKAVDAMVVEKKGRQIYLSDDE